MAKRTKTDGAADGSPSCFLRVLLNDVLLVAVASFQRGWYHSLLPLVWICSSLALTKVGNGKEFKVAVSDRETWTQQDLRVQYVVRPTDRLFVFHVAIAYGALAVVDRMVAGDAALVTVAALDCAARFGQLALVQSFHRVVQDQGRTSRCAVGLAAKHGHVDVVTYLLRHQYPTNGHHFVLHLLVRGHSEFAHFLTDEASYGEAMTAAVESGQMRVVEALWPRLHERVTSDALKTAAYLGHTDILRFLLTSAPQLNDEDVAEHAAMGGHVAILRLLYAENPQLFSDDLVETAADGFHVDAVAYLVPLVGWSPFVSEWLGQPRAGALLALVTLMLDLGVATSTDVMDNAAWYGALDAVMYLHARQPHVGCTWKGYMMAAKNGHAGTIKFLDENKCVRGDDHNKTRWFNAFDEAASQGHLAVVEHLHLVRHIACTTSAMDRAAVGGHLEVVKFLHTHRAEGCTASAMDGAAVGGHLEVVQFLHENRIEGCTADAMDGAVNNGHLDIVKFLHRHRSEGCTSYAMLTAAEHGHLDVVKFLHNYRPTDCSLSPALSCALAFNQVDVARYFLVECGLELVVPEGSRGFGPPIRDLLTSLGVDLQDEVGDHEGYYLRSDDTIDIDPPVTWLARFRRYVGDDNDDE